MGESGGPERPRSEASAGSETGVREDGPRLRVWKWALVGIIVALVVLVLLRGPANI